MLYLKEIFKDYLIRTKEVNKYGLYWKETLREDAPEEAKKQFEDYKKYLEKALKRPQEPDEDGYEPMAVHLIE